VTGKTRGEVQRQFAELRGKADLGPSTDLSQGHQTVAAYMPAWLEAAGTSTRPQTLSGYRQIVRDHITPSLGRQKPGALRPDVIQRQYAAKLSEHLSPTRSAKSISCSTARSRWLSGGAMCPTDISAHTVTKWTLDGKLLQTWGTPNAPGQPGRPRRDAARGPAG
jgi:hypothetical protein